MLNIFFIEYEPKKTGGRGGGGGGGGGGGYIKA